MISNQEPILTVGILVDTTVEFSLKGEYLLNNQIIPSGSYSATIKGGNITTSFSINHTLVLLPKDNHSSFRLKEVKIGIGFHWEQTEEQEFEGGLTLQIEDGEIRVINTIALESYLKSVVSSEMSAMNDLNLLKTHAIVSRSWLLAQILKTNTKHKINKNEIHHPIVSRGIPEIVRWYDHEDHTTFDVCADDHCQRYQGITKIISGNAKKAIDATWGQVVMYQNEICDTRFSKCCGGISEDFDQVWQDTKVPYLTAIRDTQQGLIPKKEKIEDFITSSPESFCNTHDEEVLKQILIDFDQSTTDFYRWEVIFTQCELSQLIQKKSGINFGSILDLIPVKRGKSGRIVQLKIVGSKQTVVVGKELEIRKWLSESHLYSSAFVVEKVNVSQSSIPSKFKLKGAGWGHGVGMCQIGAAVMSRKGYSSKEILQHYFKDTVVCHWYNK